MESGGEHPSGNDAAESAGRVGRAGPMGRATTRRGPFHDRYFDVVVVGGGPSGMLAAARAAERGLQVLLIEKNPALGKKLLLTGGGRCNVTNATTDRHELTARYGAKGNVLHSLFSRFSPQDMRDLLERFGVPTKVEAERRVFPVSDDAHSVLDALREYMRRGGVQILLDTTVAALVPQDDEDLAPRRIAAVRTHRKEVIRAGEVIVATGGSSRPETGSTGDGFRWLATLGIPVRRPDAALVPLRVTDPWVRDLQGLSLPHAALHVESVPKPAPPDVYDRSAWGNAKRVFSREGKLLFTHFGLSGPLALNASAEIDRAARSSAVRLLVDPLPGHDVGALDAHVRAAAGAAGKRLVKTVLAEMVPPRLGTAICAVADVDPRRPIAELPRTGRRRIVELLRGIPCSFSGVMELEKSVVASGGVDPAQVDFRTMRVNGWSNLMVLGDMLDFNRQSGGYSLHVCWAGAWVAAGACGGTPRHRGTVR